MKIAAALLLVATVFALAGCGENKSGEAKPATSGAAAATAKPASVPPSTGSW